MQELQVVEVARFFGGDHQVPAEFAIEVFADGQALDQDRLPVLDSWQRAGRADRQELGVVDPGWELQRDDFVRRTQLLERPEHSE
jgi:hypothetical protein